MSSPLPQSLPPTGRNQFTTQHASKPLHSPRGETNPNPPIMSQHHNNNNNRNRTRSAGSADGGSHASNDGSLSRYNGVVVMSADTVSKGIPDTTAVVRNHGIRTLDGARLLTRCEVLDVSDNQLENFFGMLTLPRLRCLHAENNNIRSFAGLSYQPYLEILTMEGNPICSHKYFRIMALLCLGENLKIINHRAVTETERGICRLHGGFDSAVARCISLGWTGLETARKPNTAAFYEEIIDLSLMEEFESQVAKPFGADSHPDMYQRSLLHWVEDRRVDQGLDAASAYPLRASNTLVADTLSLRSSLHQTSKTESSPFSKLPQHRGGDPRYSVPESIENRDNWNFNTTYDQEECAYDEQGKPRAHVKRIPKSDHDVKMEAALNEDVSINPTRVRGNIYTGRQLSVGRGMAVREASKREDAEEYRSRQQQVANITNARNFLEKFKKGGRDAGVFSEGFVPAEDPAEAARRQVAAKEFLAEVNAKKWQSTFQRRAGSTTSFNNQHDLHDGSYPHSRESSCESPDRAAAGSYGTAPYVNTTSEKDSLLLHSIGADALNLRSTTGPSDRHQQHPSIFDNMHSFPSTIPRNPDDEPVSASKKRLDRFRRRRTQLAAAAAIADAGGDASHLERLTKLEQYHDDFEDHIDNNRGGDIDVEAAYQQEKQRTEYLEKASEEIRRAQKAKQIMAAEHFHGTSRLHTAGSVAASLLHQQHPSVLSSISSPTPSSNPQYSLKKPALLLNQSESKCLSSFTFSKVNVYSLAAASSGVLSPSSPLGVASSIEYLHGVTITANLLSGTLSLSRIEESNMPTTAATTPAADTTTSASTFATRATSTQITYAELQAKDIVDIELTSQNNSHHGNNNSSVSAGSNPAALSLCNLYHYVNATSSLAGSSFGRLVDAVGVRLSFANGKILEMVPLEEQRKRHVAQGLFKCVMMLRCGEKELSVLYDKQQSSPRGKTTSIM